MKTITTIGDLRGQIAVWRCEGVKIGFAPTMGNLHAGHLSLIDRLREHGALRIVVSIFVNPKQFGEGEDYVAYPRTLDDDCAQLTASGVDLLFAPEAGDIYQKSDSLAAQINIPELSSDLCGSFRPGHFSGVLTVVAILFNLVQPDIAAFGQKDYQQLVMISAMAKSLSMPVKIVSTPTVRAGDGLALSSRNQYLSDEERAIAPELYRALERAVDGLKSRADIQEIEAGGVLALRNAGFTVDYFSVRNAKTLARVNHSSGDIAVLAAARLGKTRLVDNLRTGKI